MKFRSCDLQTPKQKQDTNHNCKKEYTGSTTYRHLVNCKATAEPKCPCPDDFRRELVSSHMQQRFHFAGQSRKGSRVKTRRKAAIELLKV